MSFAPLILGRGLTAWRTLQATLPQQIQRLEQSPENARLIDAFREKAPLISTPQDVVENRSVLSVSLTAFGLESDLGNRFFVKKILSDGTTSQSALANRLSDSRYAEFSEAFGFDGILSKPEYQENFSDGILTRFANAIFEAAVGETDANLRLALNADRELKTLASKDATENTLWYSVMGSSALRTVFETVLGLPTSFANLDIDQQLGVFREKTQNRLGFSEISSLTIDENRQNLVEQFLLRAQLSETTSYGSEQIALALLQNTYVS